MTAYIGIDPGLKGGLAAIYDDQQPDIWPMPTISNGTKQTVNTATIITILVELVGPTRMIALEKVNAGAVKSRMSAFSFGRGYGRIEGALDGLGRAYDYVAPQDWTRALGIPRGAGKAEHIATAQRLFPTATITSDGEADALLIAEWCRRTWRTGR